MPTVFHCLRRVQGRRFAARLLLILMVSLAFASGVARAQEQDKAVIVGTVTDKTGAVIVDAGVTIRNSATNVTFSTKTDSKGFYTSPPLQIGTYDVTVTKPTFDTVTEPSIVLDVGSRAEINFSMRAGSVNTEVTIEAVSPALNTTSATLAYTVDQRTIEEMPLNGGNVLSLAAILPGVVNAFGAATSGFNDRGLMLSSIRIGGGAVGAYALTLDGANNQITYLGEVAINPQADAVAQFRLYNGSTPAQFGFTSGGAIDIASRAGTNSLHGTVYEFFRNDAVDAQTFFASPVLHKPELRYNRFGGSLGGPILHNKMFFFGNSERYDLVQTGPSYTTVPTGLERQGDFSQSTVLVGTACTQVGIVNPVGGAIFANSKIPSNQLDPAAVALQNAFYPLPNNSMGTYNNDGCSHQNNYVGNSKLLSHQLSIMGRTDYQATTRSGFFLRYAYYSFYTNNNVTFPSPIAGARYDKPLNQVASFGYTRVLSPSAVNELRVTGLRAKFSFLAGSHGLNQPAAFGIQNIPSTTLPYLQNGQVAFQTQDGYRSATQFQVVDTITQQIGTHALTYGVDLRFNQAENNQNPYPSGFFSFAQNTTSSTATCFTVPQPIPCAGDIYASYLLGDVNRATNYSVSAATFRSSSVSGFLQDNWRAAKGLTLNLGLRYDYQQQPYEIRNRTSNFDITRGDPVNGFFGESVYAGVGGYGRTFNRENYTDFSPRLGFAWNVPHTAGTILRGGYSVYYSSTANISFAGSTNGFAFTTTNYNSATTNGVALILEAGYPTPPVPNLGAAGGPAAFVGPGTVYYQEPNQRTPMSQVFTVSVSRALPAKFVIDVSYLGNDGMHFVQPNYNLNTPNPSYFAAYKGSGPDPLQVQVTNPYAGQIPGTFGQPKITQFYLDAPYPYYTYVYDYQPRNGRYFGNYMYVSLQRRVSRGTELIGSYTFGKLLSDPIYVPISTSGAQVLTGSGSSFQNPRDRSPEHTIDTLDVRHRATASVTSRLPFGKGQRYFNQSNWQSVVFGGVTLNTIVTLQGGTPLAIAGANNYIATRPNFSGINPHSDCTNTGGVGTTPVHTANCWFNPAAFINPLNYQFGNTPRVISTLRGPGAVNVDASILKSVRFKSRYGAEFRFEGFNIFNHPNFSNPNTTFAANLYQGSADGNVTYQTTGQAANTNGNFGKITSAGAPRTLQAGVKLTF